MFLTKIKTGRVYSLVGLVLLLALMPLATVTAVCNPEAQSCSSGYQVTESFFGAGGQFSCSGNQYCANQSAGEQTVGQACDPSDQKCIQAGFNTNRTVYLEIGVDTPNVDVGTLDPAETHVGTATFYVKSYLASGYTVQTVSPGPTNGSYVMQLMTAPANNTSSLGTEQFGMNLAQNDCPANAPADTDPGGCISAGQYGATPAQDPDASFGHGYAVSGYNTTNEYQYVNGDIIAQSDSSSGYTHYTISYLFNISNVTPGGTYTMAQSLVATSTF